MSVLDRLERRSVEKMNPWHFWHDEYQMSMADAAGRGKLDKVRKGAVAAVRWWGAELLWKHCVV